MYHILKEVYSKKKFISVFLEEDLDTFYVGYIRGISQNHIVFNAISTRGYNDGYYLLKVDDIVKISFEGQYEIKIYKLMENVGKSTDNSFEFKFSEDLFNDFFTYVSQNSFVVSLSLCDSDTFNITGKVQCIDSEVIELNQLDEYGNNDGTTIVRLDSITKAVVNSGNEINISFLEDLKGK